MKSAEEWAKEHRTDWWHGARGGDERWPTMAEFVAEVQQDALRAAVAVVMKCQVGWETNEDDRMHNRACEVCANTISALIPSPNEKEAGK